MASRSVRWRSPALPPVRNERRFSSSRSRICGAVSSLTRAAASSIASGMPSSRRQISATAEAFSAVQLERRLGVPRPLDEHLHRGRAASASRRRRASRAAERGTRARRARGAARGSSRSASDSARAPASRRAAGTRASPARSCRARSASGCRRCARRSSPRSTGRAPRARRGRRRSRSRRASDPGSARDRRSTTPRTRPASSPPASSASRLLPVPPRPVSVTSLGSALARSPSRCRAPRARPTSGVSRTGRYGFTRSDRGRDRDARHHGRTADRPDRVAERRARLVDHRAAGRIPLVRRLRHRARDHRVEPLRAGRSADPSPSAAAPSCGRT